MTLYYFAHIPKTAGTSIVHDLRSLQLKIVSKEEPLSNDVNFVGITMLRHPETHLTSLYEHCRANPYNSPLHKVVRGSNSTHGFALWVDDALAAAEQKTHSRLSSQLRFGFQGCYDPWNLQTRFLSHGSADVEQAIRQLKRYRHVGITEYYSGFVQEITNRSITHSSHVTHSHNNTIKLENLNLETRAKMRKLIASDLQLYAVVSRRWLSGYIHRIK